MSAAPPETMPAITVAELIGQLEKLPPDTKVVLCPPEWTDFPGHAAVAGNCVAVVSGDASPTHDQSYALLVADYGSWTPGPEHFDALLEASGKKKRRVVQVTASATAIGNFRDDGEPTLIEQENLYALDSDGVIWQWCQSYPGYRGGWMPLAAPWDDRVEKKP